MLVVNVKRQSSLLTCPLQGLEVTTRRKTRWITYCSQVLKTSLFTWIVSFVTPASDTQPLQWWCEALGLEMLLTSRISQVETCRQIWESEYLRSAVTWHSWQLHGFLWFSSLSARSWHRWLLATYISIFSSSEQFECWGEQLGCTLLAILFF